MSDNADLIPAARRPAVGARRPFHRRRKSCPFSGKKQRELAIAIKRARFLALLPYVIAD
jgi:small subunit ribosomal protein S18